MQAAVSAIENGPETRLQPRPALTNTMMEHRMAKSPLPDAETLRNLFSYCPETGILSFKERPSSDFPSPTRQKRWNTMFAGKPALSNVQVHGYLGGGINGVKFLAHRVIWKIVHGEDPSIIDHINGDRTDNRLINLRNVNRKENARNKAVGKKCKSGVLGVTFEKGAWVAKATDDDGIIRYLGRFKDFDDAVTVRRKAEARFGYHENHGKRN